MGISELYKLKGELITQIEVAQARLKSVNEQIVTSMNGNLKEEVKEEASGGK